MADWILAIVRFSHFASCVSDGSISDVRALTQRMLPRDLSNRFRRYIDSLNAAHDLPIVWDREGGRLIEVTIGDGGVGIAARMAGGLDVFEGPLRREAEYFARALLPGGSTKSASAPGRGQGFRKMLRACFKLSGFIVVRTGRLRALRTYRRIDGSNEPVDFDSTESDAYVPDINCSPLPLLAGTSVSLVFPIERVRALRTTQVR